MSSSRALFVSITLASAVVACSMLKDEEDTAQTSSAVTTCGSNLAEVDGVWAKSNGLAQGTATPCAGSTAVGALAYQCVEFAQRYMNAKFGIAALWPVQYARQMCSSHPAGVTPHEPRTGYTPKHGDLVVFDASWGGGYGHVGVVRAVNGTSMEIVEQNGNADGLRYHPVDAWDIECYVSANANTGTGGGTTGPAGTCAFGDGLYCGTNGAGSDASKLYRCAGGVVSVVETCALGCEWRPNGENDRCRTNATCPYGEGAYCGGNGITGAASVLFQCGGGKIVATKRCTNGCDARNVGENDRCF